MNGGIPGNKQTILLNAITIGAHYGMQYQEIYLADLEDPVQDWTDWNLPVTNHGRTKHNSRYD
jgi:hypothetical protein